MAKEKAPKSSFGNTIGYTGPITTTSVGLGQAAGSPVGGYPMPKSEAAPGAPPRDDVGPRK